MVGFNRRFAPLLTDLRDRFGDPGGNSSLRYLVNAGRLDSVQLVPRRRTRKAAGSPVRAATSSTP